ncbi:MAG TPA: phosphotransferase family protein [Quisquiliibacterium sp.]|nr:phosphotransferase family protein [Quisquiliibacterium sp.]
MDSINELLAKAVRRHLPGATGIADLRRLSGGASQETWSFDACFDDRRTPLILRRDPKRLRRGRTTALSIEIEGKTLKAAARAGVPVPAILGMLDDADDLGDALIMQRLEGETIARKLLRDDEYAQARRVMAGQCGETLAKIHATDVSDVPELVVSPALTELARYHDTYRRHNHPHPVFDLAFRWLREHAPETPARPTLVHGDFRNGNLMFGPEGLRAVLDWELCHLGDPMEDLGWLCTCSWRFGNHAMPVGGFGQYDDLFAGYERASGRAVDPERVRFWVILGSLKWGVMCCGMADTFESGNDRTIERAMVGRRASENEIDLLRHLLAI